MAKKILLDARFYGLENAGLGRYTINLIENLAKIDYENEYVLLLRKKYFNKLNLPMNFRELLADFNHYTLKEQFLLPKIIYKESPNIFHALHTNVPLLYSGVQVVTIHDLTQLDFERKATTLPIAIYLIKHLGYNIIFKTGISKAAKIIVPTNFVKNELASRYPFSVGKIEIIYEGVTHFVSTTHSTNDIVNYKLHKPYFIYVGSAYPHKNLETAIKAIVLLNKEVNYKVLLVLVSGRSIFRERLKSLIRKHVASEYVKLLGFVSDERIQTLLKNSIGFVYPSFVEGFGLQGLEAMIAKTLLLASDIPTFKEIYKDNAVYFNPHDFKSVSKSMKLALDLVRNAREERLKRAEKFAKTYSWQKMAKETLQVYNSLK